MVVGSRLCGGGWWFMVVKKSKVGGSDLTVTLNTADTTHLTLKNRRQRFWFVEISRGHEWLTK